MATSAAFPAMIGVLLVVLIVVLSIISLRRVRWRSKPHLGNWKEWPDQAAARTERGGTLMLKKLLAVVALVCAVLVLFHVHIGDLDGLRILAIGLGALAVAALR